MKGEDIVLSCVWTSVNRSKVTFNAFIHCGNVIKSLNMFSENKFYVFTIHEISFLQKTSKYLNPLGTACSNIKKDLYFQVYKERHIRRLP